MKSVISNFLRKKNAKRFSLFFALAFVFLIFSKLSNDYKQTIKLKVDINNLDEEIIIENDSLNILEAVVEAKGFALVPFLFNDYKTIKVDADKDMTVRAEGYIFDVTKQRYMIENQLRNSYKLLSIKPDTLNVKYSKMAFKYVDVIVSSNLQFSLGYDLLGDLVKDIDSVKLIGAQSKLDTITSIETNLLDLADISADIEQELRFKTSYLKDIQIVPEKTIVTGKVARFTEGSMDVPVIIKNTPVGTNINYFPKAVTVSFYVDLNSYNKIKQSDFNVECDFNAVIEGQQYLTPKITEKPEFVKRATIKQKRVDFIKI